MMKIKQKPCTICIQSCPFDAVEIEDSEDCVRINPESFRIIKNEERCEECKECFCLLYCPINEIISTDIFFIRDVVKNKTAEKTVEGCNTCFICRGTPACMNVKSYRGLTQITGSFFNLCFLLFFKCISLHIFHYRIREVKI